MGVPLADHLHDAGDMTTPVSESEFIEIDAILDDDDELDDAEDDAEDDDEKTEHVAFVIDPTDPRPPGKAVGVPTPRDFASLVDPLPTFTSAPPLPDDLDGPTVRGGESPGGSAEDAPTFLLGPPRSARHAVPGVLSPRGPGWHATPSVPFAPVTGTHPVPGASSEPTVSLRRITGAHPVPAPGAPATPSAPAFVMGSPASAPGMVPAAMPGAHVTSSPPYPVPPWQAGRPPIHGSADRGARAWAIVDLPVFDPVAFERRRRIVLRVAVGLVGFILLLAIFAGRC